MGWREDFAKKIDISIEEEIKRRKREDINKKITAIDTELSSSETYDEEEINTDIVKEKEKLREERERLRKESQQLILDIIKSREKLD